MERSIGRVTEPTTEADEPDTPGFHTPEVDADVRRRVRDIPPSMMREDTGVIDLDELQQSVDPLDDRRPGRPTGDPLDPDGDVI